MGQKIKRLMVANRSEIAIRVFRAAAELGIRTVALYAEEDRLSLHRFKADEAYRVGAGKGPLQAYLAIDDIIDIATREKIDAIHPGYGFLSEDPAFAEACAAAGIRFIGPTPETLRQLGNKVAARNLARSLGVPVMPATGPLPTDPGVIHRLAKDIGYPVMLKASWGGGGRGMRPIDSEEHLLDAVTTSRREAAAAFGKDEVYLEKLVRAARHVEVQLLGDSHGTLVHLFERDCSIQRRHQKVIERAPAPYLDSETRRRLTDAALKIGRATGYVGAGTVEFLMDVATNDFFFIEVNPRIQVEHTVTEVVTGLDLVKAQIRIAEGGHIGQTAETGIPAQEAICLNGHAMQCRITTEDPERGFVPDYGRISAYRGASGFGIRVDGGTAYSGAVVTPFYDAMLEKVTAWAPTPDEVIARMERVLREYRIRGIATNLPFLEAILAHPDFRATRYTTRFIDETPALFNSPRRRDRATKLLTYIADITVNGHPEMAGRPPRAVARIPEPPRLGTTRREGTKQGLDRLGADGFARWMRAQDRVLITDTTLRDAHQSLLATRLRSYDIVRAAEAYATGLPDLLSLECWGGATFDVALRFLSEDPWERLAAIRERVPNILLQMLLRGANGVGYTNYPDNVVRFFVARAAEGGIDLFRIFDCLNWIDNMRVAIDAVCEAGKIAEGAICYTGDILDPDRAKYSLRYYVDLAQQLDAAGCHVIAIKDMAGLLSPKAAKVLVRVLRNVTDRPLHLHTHDTSGTAAATLIAAIDAGVDAVDLAMDALSGTTSQPCLGSVVAAIGKSDRDSGLDAEAIRRMSLYWEDVRALYGAFESDLRAGASEVYLHEMPGGQFTNLKEQARALGLANRWHDVAAAYRQANDLFGDIVKVTPSSKVVGDMALMMVSQGLTPEDVLNPDRDIAFPASVVDMLKGDLGQPYGGWPEALRKKVLKGQAPLTVRPGALLGTADLGALRAKTAAEIGRPVDNRDLASALMYPKVFADFARATETWGPVAVLPTPTFFGGMKVGEEIVVEIEPGKSLIIVLQAIGAAEPDGKVKLFFELNGQPRVIRVADRSRVAAPPRPKAIEGDDRQVAAPMAGAVSSILAHKGQAVAAGDPLLTLEAMKMETTLHAPRDGIVADLLVQVQETVESKDLLLLLQ
ncbi:pyruvate carboxylase [Rhodospirillum rubrum F11]|uniref:Pyruvate carboxylase n=3 Tax=Rhodospirillum rubrum TaxID=1085 RepID=Q2RRX8_RHORT|nr:pyruvate carboxylase [Rhodospirillum rubrum]ABC23117.1 Pyruvate carboxylase [Rhodospirillum rubrum ATCC 11170]AEO48847.1 pyruvate carboxylase [Rhodospirillum rubrum F11]MBK5954731.1 pyruvate carboxylase [Rhodospirillum rubrum]QXG79101.1 pyruvate carboxylase [Rhodospirillum rubrum]HCF18000.1 pyruvate carboxylase [Rhodospirillum rubrum]